MSHTKPATEAAVQIEFDGDVAILAVVDEHCGKDTDSLQRAMESGNPLAKIFRRLARRLIDAGRRFFVLDLGGITHADQEGVVDLIAFHTMAAREDCLTLLIEICDELHRSLETQAFDPTLDGGPFESVDSAIDSLKSTLGL